MHERKRLHISPFNPDLLPIVLPAEVFHLASNISFHSVQTSQHTSYGFVDLPTTPADKLKKKFNGSILKGSKMRVEEARPEQAKNKTAEDEKPLEDGLPQGDIRRGKQKVQKVDGVIPGVQLPEGRKVRRGWTEPASTSQGSKISNITKEKRDKKLKLKLKPSSFTSTPECLFKTKLPPNAAATRTKVKKRKRETSDHGAVIHEFENTTKYASFLRDNQRATGSESASEYIEGKGWIDQKGNILEDLVLQRKPLDGNVDSNIELTERSQQIHDSEGHELSRIPSIYISDSKKNNGPQDPDDETSSSGTSSSLTSDSEGNSSAASVQRPIKEVPEHENIAENLSSEKDVSSPGAVDGGADSNLINNTSISPQGRPISSPELKPFVNDVHPLEALFKRPRIAASSTPKKPSLEVSTSFNFFDPDIDEGPTTGHLVPHTPFTQQDFRERRQRSAAPTPDTAAPGKTFGDLWAGISSSEDDATEPQNDDPKQTPEPTSAGGNQHPAPATHHDNDDPTNDNNGGGARGNDKPETEFAKWFWEHRGETNRAWKRRRRDAAKEKRQRDGGRKR